MRTLNQRERWVLAAYSVGNPAAMAVYALEVHKCIQKAEALAYAKFPGSEIHNGRGDALKHCYLSALLFINIGEDFAADFMNAHEEVDPGETNPPEEERMDRFNNAVGRHIAADNPNASEGQLGELCTKAVLAGQTQVLTGPGKNTPCTTAYPS